MKDKNKLPKRCTIQQLKKELEKEAKYWQEIQEGRGSDVPVNN